MGGCFRARWCHWIGMLALVAGLVFGGLGALLLGPMQASALSGTLQISDGQCPSQSDFQTDLDTYQEIDYTGSTPCTINLTSSLNVSGGVTQTIDGGNAGFVFAGDAVPTANPPTPGTFLIFYINDSGNPSTFALRHVTVENGGYGIYGANSMIDLDQSTVQRNLLWSASGSTHDGYGIYANNVNLTRSTIANNHYGVSAFGSVTVVNSTIANNTYYGLDGGTAVTTTSSTFSGNGLGFQTYSGIVTLTSTIMADSENCTVAAGTIIDGGNNLSTGGYCDVTMPVVSADTLNLQPLGNYGGPTQTIALGPGSVAIDAIDGTTCETYTYPVDVFYLAGATITTDQRGTNRPQGTKCDVGAYEAPSVTVTTTPGSPDPTTGWFNASTLSAYSDQVDVQLIVNGLAPDQWTRCGNRGVVFGLGTVNGSYTFDQTVGAGGNYPDGSYPINGGNFGCAITQGLQGAPLGFSLTGLSTIKVDTGAPTITSPADGVKYTIGSKVPLECDDATSGIVTCQVTVTPPSGSPVVVGQGQNLPTSQFGTYTVTPNTVTDNAGNSDTTALSYTVTGYATVALPGNTDYVRQGYYAVIRITFSDGNNTIASRNLPVTSVSLVGPEGSNEQTIPFVHPFQFARFSGTPGYQLQINTRNLARGSWTLDFHLGGAHPQDGQVTFTVY